MNIFYYANQIYQFSYSLPLFKHVGGTYLVNDLNKLYQFSNYMLGVRDKETKPLFIDLPRVRIEKFKQNYNKTGIIFSHSNKKLPDCNGNMIRVFIGHGTGDKPYGGNRIGAENFLNYNYIFLSGPKHLTRLKESHVDIPEERLVKIGNMRFDDYVNGKIDKSRVIDNLGIKDREKKNVLYAPTWRFGKGTFHKYAKHFARELTKEFNLIIRPHYHDAKHIPAMKFWAWKHGIKNLYFSHASALEKNDTMFDFAISDIMISDTSSVLYEYLITKNPIIVIDNGYKKLQKMPEDMDIMKHSSIFTGKESILDLVKSNLEEQTFREDYSTMLNACFYFNDGKSTERAISFLNNLRS